jgi:polyphosphate glucokinase
MRRERDKSVHGESVSRISEIRRSQRKFDAELRAAPLPSTDAPEPRKTTVKHFHSSTQRGRHKILVIDVGGTHVKMSRSSGTERREFNSGSDLTAADMVRQVLDLTKDWEYDVVSIGYPGPVVHNRPLAEPHNLGKGWVGFDFRRAFARPVRIVNDAVMQALGSYSGGRMLFLGLGTGLGSAMIVDGVVQPMELAHLEYRHGKTFEHYLGLAGLDRMGLKKWRQVVTLAIEHLTAALEPDYVVLGGGNAAKLKTLPPLARLGKNEKAFLGGFRLWDDHRQHA